MKRVARRQFVLSAAAALFAAVFWLNLPANAQTFSSSYTSAAPKDCRTVGKSSDPNGSARQVCPGKSGLIVLISDDDLRETVSSGRAKLLPPKSPRQKPGSPPSIRAPIPLNGERWTASHLRSFSAG
jgi:hypothetical protein